MEDRSERHPPAHYMTDGEWPDGPLLPNAPPEAHLAAAVAIRLRKHMKGRTQAKIGDLSGLGRQTINNILNGNAWPDLRTIARLEVALDKPLWGREHRDEAKERD
jgi:DNA-binding XRE family transcriptional regulator